MAEEELVDAVARAICDAAKIWKSADVWGGAERGDATCKRLVNRYRSEARAAMRVLREHGIAKAVDER
jgi:hypothetical protein